MTARRMRRRGQGSGRADRGAWGRGGRDGGIPRPGHSRRGNADLEGHRGCYRRRHRRPIPEHRPEVIEAFEAGRSAPKSRHRPGQLTVPVKRTYALAGVRRAPGECSHVSDTRSASRHRTMSRGTSPPPEGRGQRKVPEGPARVGREPWWRLVASRSRTSGLMSRSSVRSGPLGPAPHGIRKEPLAWKEQTWKTAAT
jgi:hypothetical protein